MQTFADLHDDCIEDCCWARRLEAAGGPTPITGMGLVSAVLNGTLRSNDDGEWEFQWDRLPRVPRSELNEAERLRKAFIAAAHNGTATMSVRDGSGQDYVRRVPELQACIEKAVELGVKTPEGVADWLGIAPEHFSPGWFIRPAVDLMIRQGYRNQEIIERSIKVWGHPVQHPMVSQRRRRLAPAEAVAA